MRKEKSGGFIVFLAVMFISLVLFPFRNVSVTATAEDELLPSQRILTVVMYHSVMKGRNGKYVISPAAFESDVKELLSRGYETVFPSEIVRFAEHGGPLPKKPLLITFDDGHYNNAHYCKPILEKYGCKAVVNIVGSYCDYAATSGEPINASYSYFNWEQIKELNDGATFEIGNHSYDMHNKSPRFGITRMSGESDAHYKAALTKDIMKLQNKLTADCGVTPVCFAYPFGSYSKFAREALAEMGFKLILNCEERRNLISEGDSGVLLNVCRFNRDAFISTQSFFEKMERSRY